MNAPEECSSIEEVRAAIDSIDRDIVAALGKRYQYVQTITRFKRTANDVRARERYEAVLQQRRAWAVEAGLDPDVIEQMYRNLIAHFIDEEMKALRLADDAHA